MTPRNSECIAIHTHVVPYNEQRYPTVGDWWFEPHGEWQIRATLTKDWRYGFLVALHEQIEAALCKHRGISEQDVTAFDTEFEAMRPHGDDSEPGDAPNAPYRREHRFATVIEELVAHELGVNWALYEAELERVQHDS